MRGRARGGGAETSICVIRNICGTCARERGAGSGADRGREPYAIQGMTAGDRTAADLAAAGRRAAVGKRDCASRAACGGFFARPAMRRLPEMPLASGRRADLVGLGAGRHARDRRDEILARRFPRRPQMDRLPRPLRPALFRDRSGDARASSCRPMRGSFSPMLSARKSFARHPSIGSRRRRASPCSCGSRGWRRTGCTRSAIRTQAVADAGAGDPRALFSAARAWRECAAACGDAC